jgi:hypothetical protein
MLSLLFAFCLGAIIGVVFVLGVFLVISSYESDEAE